jgi:hypothetical protein
MFRDEHFISADYSLGQFTRGAGLSAKPTGGRNLKLGPTCIVPTREIDIINELG